MSRKISTIQYIPPQPGEVKGNPVDAIEQQAQTGAYQYLLAYADDGLVWGAIDKNKVLTRSSDKGAFPEISPKLHPETLWEARLFGKDAEWCLWKTDEGWHSREIADTGKECIEAFDEDYILWGTNVGEQESKSGFYLTEEIGQGIRHTPPKPLTGRHSLKLKVRHYLNYDEAGAVYVKYSRLVDLLNGGEK
jgi:CRISPR-associated protein (TIGR03984 family)